MFLIDCAEFGRIVIVKEQQPKYVVGDTSTYKQLSKTPYSPLIKNGIRGDYYINTKSFTNGESKRVIRSRRYIKKLNPSEYADKNFTKYRRNYNRETIRGLETQSQERLNDKVLQQRPANKKPLRKPTQKTSYSTQKTSKPLRKLLNKYTLGGLGVLGGVATAYGGYKLLTPNKNKKDK